MSRLHDAQRNIFPLGNPFWIILHKASNKPLKLREILVSFEKSLADQLKKLHSSNVGDITTLSWMVLAIGFLSGVHNSIKTLINELQLPVSNWDEKWIDIYLDSSVKLLDICIALSSELSWLSQGQLMLQYSLHFLDFSSSDPSSEQLTRAHLYVHQWMEHINSKSSKLHNCSVIIESLQGTLTIPKVKSSKGKVLMRALYGVKVMTVFICGVFAAMLSGCSKTVVDLHVSDDFFWFEAFRDLQAVVNGKIRRQIAWGEVIIFKEMEAVEICTSRLHNLINNASCEKDLVRGSNDANHEVDDISIGKTTNLGRQGLRECVINLVAKVKQVDHELDSLSKQVDDFFQIVLEGRNALLCNLRPSATTLENNIDDARS